VAISSAPHSVAIRKASVAEGSEPGPELSGALATLAAVAKALELAGARFFVGGSLASSLQGIPRSTQDVDLVADLAPSRVGVFLGALGAGFYADRDRILDGITRRASFNVIDLDNGFKADVYLAADDEFGRSQFERSQRIDLAPDLTLPFASAEDVVLQKLRWFRLGGGVSERQWLDALGVIKVQGPRIDRGYLERWAETLDLAKLLGRLLEESGIEEDGA
jgi:hypothetical protein